MIALSKPLSLVVMSVFCKPGSAMQRGGPLDNIQKQLDALSWNPVRPSVDQGEVIPAPGQAGGGQDLPFVKKYSKDSNWICDCGTQNHKDVWQCPDCDVYRIKTVEFKKFLQNDLENLKRDQFSQTLAEAGLGALREHLEETYPEQCIPANEQEPAEAPRRERVARRREDRRQNHGDEKEVPVEDSPQEANARAPPVADAPAPPVQDLVDDASNASQESDDGDNATGRCRDIFQRLSGCGYCCVATLGLSVLYFQLSQCCQEEGPCQSIQTFYRTLCCCADGFDMCHAICDFLYGVGNCCGQCCDAIGRCCNECGECLNGCDGCDGAPDCNII